MGDAKVQMRANSRREKEDAKIVEREVSKPRTTLKKDIFPAKYHNPQLSNGYFQSAIKKRMPKDIETTGHDFLQLRRIISNMTSYKPLLNRLQRFTVNTMMISPYEKY